MAPRIRSIKPSLWDSESLGRCSVLARLTFVGMISMADDDGRGRSDIRYLKARIHTYANDVDDDGLVKALGELDRERCVIFYQENGSHYYSLPGWHGNQVINRRTASALPPPPGADGKRGAPKSMEVDGERHGDPIPPVTKPEPPVLLFPVAPGTGPKEWALRSPKIMEYRLSFPGIDVEARCRAAWQWCQDNPAGRKPYDGMAAFLNRWLAKDFRESQQGKIDTTTAAENKAASVKCIHCYTRPPMSKTWPYCASCTYCTAGDCTRAYPEHKTFMVRNAAVHCNICAEAS